ncbi:jg20640 [Pararge aegeria aegeria]|uniref:Jg20640 protein n=1 Tax=Pararge aegeria aegeria TaxID=348720 RepID=A0A8S4RD79_9NEOP|nr:jg20640 [Pararge aegeria aegeria]
MKKASSANYDICGTMDDVQHVLVECSRYNLERLDVMRRYKINRFDVGALTNLLSQPTTEGFRSTEKTSIRNQPKLTKFVKLFIKLNQDLKAARKHITKVSRTQKENIGGISCSRAWMRDRVREANCQAV